MNLFELFAKITLDGSEYEKGLEKASGLTQSVGGKIGSALGTAAKVGAAALTAASGAAVAFGTTAVQAGMEFDSTMSQVAAISGATGGEFDALRDKAKEMGASTMFSASQSAEAFTYMAMAGWKTADMLDGIEGIMNLAAASGEDLATTSDIVTDALTAFGLTAADSGHFADILAVASSNANTNVGMMGETFKYVAPVAGALGISAEDTAEAIGLMANSGIKASQAGTSLRSIFTRLSTNAGETKTQMGALSILTQRLGVEFYNTDGTVRDFSDVLAEARVAWAGLNQEEQTSYGKIIAGQEALSGWLSLMNAAPGDVEKLHTAIENADGAALEMSETMQDNLSGAITIFKSALEGVQIAVSDELTPALTDFVNLGTEGLSDLAKAINEDGLGGAVNALGPFIDNAIGMLMEGIPKVIEFGAQLLIAIVTGIIDNLPKLADGAAQVAESLGTQLMEKGPALLEKGGELLAFLANGIVESVPKLLEAAAGIVSGLGKYLKEKLPELIPAAVDTLVKLADYLTDPKNLLAIVKAAGDIIEGLLSGILAAIPKLLTAAPQIIGKLAVAIIAAIPEIIKVGLEIVGGLLAGIAQGFVGLLAAIPNFVKGLIDGFKNLLGIHSPSTIFADIGKNIVEGLKNGIANVWESITRFFTEKIEAIKAKFTQLGSSLKTIGGNIVSGLKRGISAAWEGASGIAKWFSGKVGGLVSAAKEKLDIHSPSKVFEGIGGNMALGLGQGWEEQYNRIQRSITDGLSFSAFQIPATAGAYTAFAGVSGGKGYTDTPPIIITVQSVLDGKIVGETVTRYQNNQRRAYGTA